MAIIITPLPAPHESVYRLGITGNFEAQVNISRLEDEMMAALPGRVWSVKKHNPSNAVDVGAMPQTVFSASEMTTINNTLANHNPATQSSAQVRAAEMAAARLAMQTYWGDPNPNANQERAAIKGMMLVLGLIDPDA